VADAWADELLSGYAVDVEELVAGSVMRGAAELVVVRDIPVSTVCPHHLLVSSGTATVALSPHERLVGVGTVAAVVDAFARRLSLQEQVGENVVAALGKHLAPRWVACRLVMTHGCMTARGERAHGARVETVALTPAPADARDLAVVHGALGVGT
jgi:GTP cyclohydrolase I